MASSPIKIIIKNNMFADQNALCLKLAIRKQKYLNTFQCAFYYKRFSHPLALVTFTHLENMTNKK